MSNGLREAIKEFWRASDQADRDALDGLDPWDNEEITQVIKDLNGKPVLPWFDPADWHPKERKCDCGGAKANTTHAHWCSLGNK